MSRENSVENTSVIKYLEPGILGKIPFFLRERTYRKSEVARV